MGQPNSFVAWEEKCQKEIVRFNEWLKKLETYEEFATLKSVTSLDNNKGD